MTDTLISMAFGIFLGALVSSIGYLVKIRRERNRVFNESLFSLLEIWHQARLLTPLDVDAVLAVFTEELKKRHPEVELEIEDLEGPKIAIENHAKELITGITSKTESSLCESYRSAISGLCKEAPILAYKLNGHQNLKHNCEQLDHYFNQIKEVSPTGDDDAKSMEFANQLLQKCSGDAKNTIFSNLERDLLTLASFLGNKTKKQVSEMIKIEKKKEDNGIKELVNELIQHIETTAKAVSEAQAAK
jgi:hypothetical protein